MSRHNDSVLVYDGINTQIFTISAGQNNSVYVDLEDCEAAHFIVQTIFATTASSSSISISTFYGIGSPTSIMYGAVPASLTAPTNVTFGDNSDSITTSTIATNSSNIVANTWFTTNDMIRKNSRHLRIKITNNDLSNSCIVKIIVEI